MSTLVIFPLSAGTDPDIGIEAAALAALRGAFPGAVAWRGAPQFFDAGPAFQKVACPETGKRLDMEWWGDAMEDDFDGAGHALAPYPAPCGHEHRLDELAYDAAGFARFALLVDGAEALPADQRAAVEAVLGPVTVLVQPF